MNCISAEAFFSSLSSLVLKQHAMPSISPREFGFGMMLHVMLVLYTRGKGTGAELD